MNAFTDVLRKEGITLWQDNSGSANGIPFSTRWMETIEQAIYMAGGALVFRSDNWEKSVPCRKEMEIITKCDVPYLELAPDPAAMDPHRYIELVKAFRDEKVLTDENRRRTELFHNAYETRSGMDPIHLVKSTRGITGALKYLRTDIKAYQSDVRGRGYEELNPDIYPYMKKYVSFAKRTARFRIVRRITGAAAAFIIIITALIIGIFVPFTEKTTQLEHKIANLVTVFASEYSWERDQDPVRWMKDLTMLGSGDYTEQDPDSGVMVPLNRLGAETADMILPCLVVEKTDSRYESLLGAESANTSEYYEAELSENTGSIYVTDLSTGTRRTLAAGSAPSCFAWSPDGRVLAYSAGSDVYAYDAAGHSYPVLLPENFDQVVRVKYAELEGEGRCIAAVTVEGRIVVWKDPFEYTAKDKGEGTLTEDASLARGVRYGIFTGSDDPAAVYIDGGNVVMRTEDNRYSGQLEADDIGAFTLSHDDCMIAYSFSRGNDWEIMIADISSLQNNSNVRTVQHVKTEHEPTDLAFSNDDKSIYASASGCSMLRVDTVSGQVVYSGQDTNASAICAWGDNWVIADNRSNCYIYNSDMEPISESIEMNGSMVPCFDAVTDESHGYLFTVNRGATNNTGCTRVDLGSKEHSAFIFDPGKMIASNTAVAVSEDDEYVAFGYPDGSIRVFETVSMQLVEEKRCLGEAVSALKFSGDGSTLYMLGSSGNIYRTELKKYLLNNSTDNMVENWQTLSALISDKMARYSNGIKQ